MLRSGEHVPLLLHTSYLSQIVRLGSDLSGVYFLSGDPSGRHMDPPLQQENVAVASMSPHWDR